MILKKDNYAFGFIMGLLAPCLGFLAFKYTRLQALSLWESLEFIRLEPTLLSAALSVSLVANAILFTFYINAHIDKTAKGIFFATGMYGIIILILKTFI